jgi:hypothetical protein
MEEVRKVRLPLVSQHDAGSPICSPAALLVGILTHASWAPRTSFLGTEASLDLDSVQTQLNWDTSWVPVSVSLHAYLGA